jgi:hypothetical protein
LCLSAVLDSEWGTALLTGEGTLQVESGGNR